MSSLLRRLLHIEPGISLGQWAYDRIANNWQAIVLFFGGGGGMTYLAIITEWISAWGPIAWGAAFFVGAYLALGLWWAFVAISRRNFEDKMAAGAFQRSGINPRQDMFENTVVHLNDFFNPFYLRYRNKQFRNCEVRGPSLCLFRELVIIGGSTKECQIVINSRPRSAVWRHRIRAR